MVAADQPNILVLGDSISAAYGINRDQGWVNLLQLRLQEKHYNYRVINASVSGDTTLNGLSRLPSLLTQHSPQIVVIELGGNDGLRGLALSEMRNNLEMMIQLSQTHGCQVILLGIRLPPNYGAGYLQRFTSTYQSLAEQYNIKLQPRLLFDIADDTANMQQDGIHPTANAQPKLLDNVWPLLQPLLKSNSSLKTPTPDAERHHAQQ